MGRCSDMKITKRQLRRLIKEAIKLLNDPGPGDRETYTASDSQEWDDDCTWEDNLEWKQETLEQPELNARLRVNAQYLLAQGVEEDARVGIIRDEGGYLMPDVFGTVGGVLSGREGPTDWRWDQGGNLHVMGIQLIPVEAAGCGGITEEDVPFYSIGRVLA